MYWSYESKIGTFYIVPLANGRFGFKFKGEIWDAANNPQKVADNIACHCTTCPDWDRLDSDPDSDYPSDLSEWTRQP